MDLTMTMGSADTSRVQAQTNAFNRALQQQGGADQSLGRDEFLQILLTQLQNQDPTQPMEDKEFIAQMAQFSSLEQMTNVAQGFERMTDLLSSNQALGVLGRTVEVRAGNQLVSGIVSSVTNGPLPQVTINEQTFDFSAIERVIQ